MKILFIVLTLLLTACDSVPVGNVGIIVHKLGGSKGVDSEELGPGRVWLGINDELYTFPTFSQTQVWNKDGTDESITFQTNEGMSVNTDVGITYSIDPKKVSTIFEKYRKGIDEITHTYLRSMVRDALVTAASTKPIESVYGSGKTDLIREVESIVRNETKDIGIIIEHIYWIGDMRLPTAIVNSINAKAAATQMTAQREQEVAQSKAEADKVIAAARGEAESRLAIARAEAEAINIKGKALRDNPNVIELNTIEKWDGKLPQYMTGSIPFVNLK